MRRVSLLSCIILILCIATSISRAETASRMKLNFNADWRFIRDDKPDAKNAAFDDSSWTTVSCPHTYNDIDTFDDYSLSGHRGEQNQWGGRTWYRKSFTAPDAWRGKKVIIEIEAARQFAEVYLNGQMLGISRNGFLPFGFDLTPHLKIGEKNVIAIMCDNRFMKDPAGRESPPPATNPSEKLNLAPQASGALAQMSAKVNSQIPDDIEQIQPDQIPWNNPHWHPAHGGLYRNIFLHVVDPLHVSLPLYSSLETVGPYVYSTDVSEKSATVNLELPVQNDGNETAKVEISAQVLDRDGKAVATLEPVKKNIAVPQIDAGKSESFEYRGTLPSPQLWEPAYPYLYHVVATVRTNGKDVDRVEVPFGIHTVRWDAETGFYINGKHTKLKGWGQKPTDEWPGLGAAQPEWLHWFTLDLIKQAGGNWVRWGHCAAGPGQIAACDQLGIMVHQPGLDGESDTRGAAWKIRVASFRDLLVYYRNNPSILIWEGGNQKVSREHAQELRDLLTRFDPHGGRAFAFRRSDKVVAEFEDVHIGTEGGREIKQLPVIEGEYDREESPRRVWDDQSPPNFGYPEAKGMTYQLTSEQFAVNEVEHWMKKCAAADHCGGANWIFSDSTSGGRVPAEVARASGEIDGVRLPKEAYFVCQTIFSTQPQAHIIGHWSYPVDTTKTVYVTANGDDVELFVNGKSLGHSKPQNRYLFTFKDVKFEPGEIKAVASLSGKQIATHAIKTAGAPAKLKLTTIIGPTGLLANGADIALIDVEVVDANGLRCPTFQDRCDFTCSGEGIWRGGYNSGKPKSTNNLFLDLEAGINRVAVKSTLKAGKVVVTATVKDLPTATLEIPSKAVEIRDGASEQLPQLPPQELKKPTGDANAITIADASMSANAADGQLLIGFNYTGPSAGCAVKPLWRDIDHIYTDRDFTTKDLPASLKNKNGEYVQIPCNDATYSALDLIQFGAGADLDIYVAHDNALPIPKWLSTDFTDTGEKFSLGDATMSLFKRSVTKDASLTLGSNSEETSSTKGLMYVVIAVPK